MTDVVTEARLTTCARRGVGCARRGGAALVGRRARRSVPADRPSRPAPTSSPSSTAPPSAPIVDGLRGGPTRRRRHRRGGHEPPAAPAAIDWFIDPIDGTTNFVYDLPAWTTSIAAADADRHARRASSTSPRSTSCSRPPAAAGRTLNGRPIRASSVHRPARSPWSPPASPIDAEAPAAPGGDRRRPDRRRARHPPARLGRARPVLRRRRPARRLLRAVARRAGTRRPAS